MGVTINQIATMAGVSKGTVDRVLNNRGKVSPEVEKRIRIIAKELNYRPNLMAKSLALRKRAPKMGIVFHTPNVYFTEEVIRGIKAAEDELQDYGVSVEIRFCSTGDVEEQLQMIEEMLNNDISALAITPINHPEIAKKIDELSENDFPVFCFINDIRTKNPHAFVGPDAYKTGKTAGGLLDLLSSKNKREKLVIITPELKVLGHIERVRGVEDALKERHSNLCLVDVCEIPLNSIDIYKTVKEYFIEHKDVRYVWYATSLDGGLRALEELGIIEQISIIGLDLQSFTKKGLEDGYIRASISQEPYSQGEKVIRQMFTVLLTGEDDKGFFDVPSRIVLKENIE